MRPNSEAGAPSAENVYGEIYSYVSEWSISPTIREITGRRDCGPSTVQKQILEPSKVKGA